MEFELCNKYGFSVDEIAHTNIILLNKKLLESKVPLDEQNELKRLRRKIKMRKYRFESRDRKTMEVRILENVRNQLFQEATFLQDEIDQLEKNIYVMEILEQCP